MSKQILKSGSPHKLYLGGKPEAEECYPFGEDVAVFKVRGKMYATFAIRSDGFANMNLKCEPMQALALRDVFEAVIPGYHMNKKHWNTVILNGSVPAPEIERMVDHSYALAAGGLKVADKRALRALYGDELLRP